MIMVKVRAENFSEECYYSFSVIVSLLMGLWPSFLGSLTGGTFALYSLLCRHAKLCLLPNHQAADEELSTYFGPGYSNRNVVPSRFRRYIEKHKNTRTCLLLVVLLVASMVIAIGVITPSISGS